MWDITPPAPGNQDIQQRIQDLPKRRMRHPTTALGRCRGKDILEQTPLEITQPFKSTAMLSSYLQIGQYSTKIELVG